MMHQDSLEPAAIQFTLKRFHAPIVSERTHETYTRLPKRPLPTFDGNSLEWQAF